ncbi:MAG TPA: hypothetical protein VL093_13845 [Flavipsychrobacter sp.]|nr:hypothetical protein [Flavipsychrobacter sp.]
MAPPDLSGYTLLSQFSIRLCGAGFYAWLWGFCNLRTVIISGTLSTAAEA